MRLTASRASGEIVACVLPSALRRAFSAISARTKNGRLAWTQHAASTMSPGLRSCFVELVISAVSVGLENPGVIGKMRLGMLARTVA